MPLPDDILPEDPKDPLPQGVQPAAPQESEEVEQTSQEQQIEADSSFDDLRQISQNTFEAMQESATPAETEAEPELEPPPPSQPPPNAEPPETAKAFDELKQRTTAEFQSNEEPPGTLQEYLEKQAESAPEEFDTSEMQDQPFDVDLSSMESGGGGQKEIGSILNSILAVDTAQTDMLLDLEQKFNMLVRRLETGRL